MRLPLKWILAVAFLLLVWTAAVAAQTPSSPLDQVGAEIGQLIALGLGAIASLITQGTKRLLSPLELAPAWVKQIVALGWALFVAWLANRVPMLAQLLPGDPTLLPTAVVGLVAWAAALGAHAIKKAIE